MTTPNIELSEMAAALRPASATIEMVITRADGRVEYQSVTTTYTYHDDGRVTGETVETFGA